MMKGSDRNGGATTQGGEIKTHRALEVSNSDEPSGHRTLCLGDLMAGGRRREVR